MGPDCRSSALLMSLAAAAGLLVAASLEATPSQPGTYAAFATRNDAAMSKMITEMPVKPTGKVDVDFVAMMIPHHHGAIAMARAVLRYGHNEKLKVLARGIVTEQTKEIATMREALGTPVPVAAPAPAPRHMTMS